jgi:hypothetical protein
MDSILARKVARTTNPYPSIVFLAPDIAEAYMSLGMPEGRMGYFAGRSAAMGAVPAEVVIATFYGFQPEVVRSVIPDAWNYATPAQVLERRLAATDTALRRVLGDEVVDGPEVKEAAGLARVAAEACTPEARALFAGWASQPWPDAPHLELWHALTLLREHRGDGHLIALQIAGFDGCQSMVMHQAIGEIPATYASSRAWNDDQWATASDRLRSRGLIDADGVATDSGRDVRESVEHQTDLLAMGPLEALGEEGVLRLRALMRPMAKQIAAGVFPRL